MSTKKCVISKAGLRKEMLEIRRELSEEYCRMADQAILSRLLGMEIYQKSQILFTYVSREGETDTRRLLSRILSDGKTAAVPRCISGAKGVMKAFEIESPEDLEPGFYGILEPKKECREISPERIQAAVVPCVACSREGIRLGYGGGYYDRYLPLTPAVRIVLCREKLLTDKIAGEAHDCRADYVITERGILVTKPLQ